MKSLVILISFCSLSAAAAEVIKFDPRPAVVEQDGDTYVGILLSEEDFRQMLQKKNQYKRSNRWVQSWPEGVQAYPRFL